MDFAENINKLTNTFSADKNYCHFLLSSSHKVTVAETLVYYKWIRNYFPHFQANLLRMIPKHFPFEYCSKAEFWTATLTGGILKDICLVPYFLLRGVVSEAGFALRRGLEHAGVLTHLWHKPSKINVINNTEGRGFLAAFVFEENKRIKKQLKQIGIQKRFAAFSHLGKPASELYSILSKYIAHGGTPYNISLCTLEPGEFSCSFTNRDKHIVDNCIYLLCRGCEILCAEIVAIQGKYGKQYSVTSQEFDEGSRLLLLLMSEHLVPTSEMNKQIADVLADLGIDSNKNIFDLN